MVEGDETLAELNTFDISVVVLCYNPSVDKLKLTIYSIIEQKGISCEIVISDDGSKTDYRNEITGYLNHRDFRDVKFITSGLNTGTVKNTIRGVENSSSEYIKLISPGDFLAYDTVLAEWLDNLKNGNSSWSFGRAVHYRQGPERDIEIVKARTNPRVIRPYYQGNFKECRYNYLVHCDFCLGATTLCRKSTLLNYLHIIENKVTYAEDTVYLLMMSDKEFPCFFGRPVIYYETGDGISTTKEKLWADRLRKDINGAYSILLESDRLEKEIRKQVLKINKVRSVNSRVLRFIYKLSIKGIIKYWYNRVFRPAYSPNTIEE